MYVLNKTYIKIIERKVFINMSPLAKMIIQALENEDIVLAGIQKKEKFTI